MFSKSASISEPAKGLRSLSTIAALHLALAAFISFLILSVVCLYENLSDERYFTRWYGNVEIAKISKALITKADGLISFDPDLMPRHYRDAADSAYAYRVWDERGGMVAGANTAALASWSPLSSSERPNKPDAWQKKFGPHWFDTVSGKKVIVGERALWIEVGTSGDPERFRFGALFVDFVSDVIEPLVPTFLVSMLLALASLRSVLRPLRATAEAAARLTPNAEACALKLPTDGLPKEVEVLASAVNDLLGRVNELVKSQSEFIGRAAHQLRIPLATMMLEVGRCGLASAPMLQRDLERMSEMIDRLLELARMEGAPPVTVGVIDVCNLVDDVIMDSSPIARRRGGTVCMTGDDKVFVRGDYCTLREAISNLVNNAIVHHPGAPNAEVVCLRDGTIHVDDDGTGLVGITPAEVFVLFARGSSPASGSGLGLALVKRVVELHGGTVDVARSPSGGARFTLKLVVAEQPAADLADIEELPQQMAAE